MNKEHPTAEVEAVAYVALELLRSHYRANGVEEPTELGAFDQQYVRDAKTAIEAMRALSTKESDLRAENERLREALKPFADCMEYIADDESDEEWAKFRLLIKDYRRASAALQGSAS